MKQEIRKGKRTDYVNRQYLGKLGKIDNGIVAVTAWGLIDNITFPLILKFISKRTTTNREIPPKPEIAAQMV